MNKISYSSLARDVRVREHPLEYLDINAKLSLIVLYD